MDKRRRREIQPATPGAGHCLPAPRHREPGPGIAALDDRIRLFQGVIEARLLRDVSADLADNIRPAAERAWFDRIAPLTGLPAVLGGAPPHEAVDAAPAFVLHPRPRRLEELREAHVELRRRLPLAADVAAADRIRSALALSVGIARALRAAGLWPAYVTAARRSRRAAAATLPRP